MPWTYNTVKAPKSRINPGEMEGHKYEFGVREDSLKPSNDPHRREVMARCSCGWKSNIWRNISRWAREIDWGGHMEEARKQGSLYERESF